MVQGLTDQKKSERSREETLARAAKLKRERSRDASQAMKDLEAARQETLAKTARLRAERLARLANEVSAAPAPAAKKLPAKKLPTAKKK